MRKKYILRHESGRSVRISRPQYRLHGLKAKVHTTWAHGPVRQLLVAFSDWGIGASGCGTKRQVQ